MCLLPDAPERTGLIGWRYGGQWYLCRQTVAFDYWLDVIGTLAQHRLDCDRARRPLDEPLDSIVLPQFRDVLDSLK